MLLPRIVRLDEPRNRVRIMNKEQKAIKLALSLVIGNKWGGKDDFSRGMRMLRKSLVRQAKKNRLTKQ